jgi:lipopolysaccharide/colanic/teichoic acid biosynthesis glycosyltransferase
VQTSPVERDFSALDPDTLVNGSLSATPYAFRGREYALPVSSSVYPITLPRARAPHAPSERDERESGWRDLACRSVSFVVALIGLVLALPLTLLVALAVRLSSPGPVLYVQERVGVDRRRGSGRSRRLFGERRQTRDHGGKLFRIYKFRTMYVHERCDEQVWASKDDRRITAVGRFLRAYRLDEVPQLINVLRGEMNIVGPRPEQPKIFQELRDELEGYTERQKVLPGITGWAQVNHHYDQSIEDVRKKLRLDLEYISRRSALEDLKIMARTMPVMMLRKGAR